MSDHVPGERFIDTNIFIRHITGDHEVHSPLASALFQRIEQGLERCWTSHVTIAECAWVLTGGVYRVPRAAAAEALEPILALPGLRIQDKGVVLQALRIFRSTNLGFIDAYHAAVVSSSDNREVYSWDRGLDQISALTRLEPGAS